MRISEKLVPLPLLLISNKAKNSANSKHLVQNFKNKENRVIRKLAIIIARNKENNHDYMNLFNEGSVFSRFGFTIKIESLLAVFLLLAASLLSITSPNSMSMASMPNMTDMPNMAHTPSTYIFISNGNDWKSDADEK